MSAKPQNKPPADVPTDFGKHLRACMRCKLLKTFEQVRLPRQPRQGARVRTRGSGTRVMRGMRLRLRATERLKSCNPRGSGLTLRCAAARGPRSSTTRAARTARSWTWRATGRASRSAPRRTSTGTRRDVRHALARPALRRARDGSAGATDGVVSARARRSVGSDAAWRSVLRCACARRLTSGCFLPAAPSPSSTPLAAGPPSGCAWVRVAVAARVRCCAARAHAHAPLRAQSGKCLAAMRCP